jgi:hypothetical protein
MKENIFLLRRMAMIKLLFWPLSILLCGTMRLLTFYRESKDVNEEAFKKFQVEYKFFLFNEDAQIVYYQYADGRLMDRTIK